MTNRLLKAVKRALMTSLVSFTNLNAISVLDYESNEMITYFNIIFVYFGYNSSQFCFQHILRCYTLSCSSSNLEGLKYYKLNFTQISIVTTQSLDKMISLTYIVIYKFYSLILIATTSSHNTVKNSIILEGKCTMKHRASYWKMQKHGNNEASNALLTLIIYLVYFPGSIFTLSPTNLNHNTYQTHLSLIILSLTATYL